MVCEALCPEGKHDGPVDRQERANAPSLGEAPGNLAEGQMLKIDLERRVVSVARPTPKSESYMNSGMASRGRTDLESLKKAGYQIEFHAHARAILEIDFPEVLVELEEVLSHLTIPIEEIVGSGGGETKGTQRLRRALTAKSWTKTNFEIKKVINGVERESISHEVDHVRKFESAAGEPAAMVALEIEWNNKDPFFDRDLENFKRLHAEGAISAGIVVTRGEALQAELRNFIRRWVEEKGIDNHDQLAQIGLNQTTRQKREVLKRVERRSNPVPFRDAWTDHFVSDKFGMATTHWSKLADRVRRGVGNPCPMLLIGIPPSVVRFGEPATEVQQFLDDAS